MEALKGRIKEHYDKCSPYYFDLWGEHIHHGYWLTGDETKEQAQNQLIELLIKCADLKPNSKILDVGCGVGGTTMYLAKNHSAQVTGVTISSTQIEMATKRAAEQGLENSVKFVLLDAEKMGEHFKVDSLDEAEKFDVVWISEAMSHLPNKTLFFQNAFKLLKSGGVLVVADWFKAAGLTPEQEEQYTKPIEVGMLLPELNTTQQYVDFALEQGFQVKSAPKNISEQVARTWDISWDLVQKPGLWKLAFEMGLDFINFLKAFQSMRTGFSSKTFEYGVMSFQKP